MRALVLAALLLGACASTMTTAPVEPLSALPAAERRAVTDTEQQLRQLAAELDALSAQATPPGCERVTVLRDNICTLADRICRLAERYPQETTLRPRCTDARQRCGRAAETAKQRGCGQ